MKISRWFLFCFQIVLYLCNCICPLRLWGTLRCAELLGGALHIKRRYWRFVFGRSKLPQSNREQEQMQGWLPRGVVYTLRSVLRGSGILNAHFTGVYILQRGMFLCLFFSKAVEGRERRTGRCKHPAFLFVVSQIVKPVRIGCLRTTINRTRKE